MDDNDLLNQQLEREQDSVISLRRMKMDAGSEASPEIYAGPKEQTYCQWSVGPNENFRPAGRARKTLMPGVYEPMNDDQGIYFQLLNVVTDDLIELDDSASVRVLEGMRVFWRSKSEYTKRGIIYKRGILLWGPAGSGKTATLSLLFKELLSANGLVIICTHPDLTAKALGILRRIEPDRNIILVMEDIDELIQKFGEHGILSLLDGDQQVQNVVNLATTNFPEVLGARIVNRPSRFDERILVDMPSEAARAKYLRHATANEDTDNVDIHKWVEDTEGFSVAHLRELVVAVFCLKQEYRDVLQRLKKMGTRIRARDEFLKVPMFAAGGE